MENQTAENSPSEQRLIKLSDMANAAHLRIQQDFAQIDPVIGISRNMRKNGVPADVMTIDCLKTSKRIIVILHDQNPEQVLYKFAFKEQDPAGDFSQIAFAEFNQQVLYDWIKSYFSPAVN
ncbi:MULTISPECIES: hypothetical protein [Agarivorans]|uniref:Uncharacterized protein n=1 Tax=Agarivorans albus MKT 106 TaxID=1331007 RepID=R9PNN7_AGAAL|nr:MULTISPECIES: hypothetical protein [Agarivorans]UQN41721.1 hypothetical protein LQZ07_18385 [Agarivorans sp. B2Z047]GAD02873.1 hypothetical protein AALB_2953 [Agarivorans albus MKT 106]